MIKRLVEEPIGRAVLLSRPCAAINCTAMKMARELDVHRLLEAAGSGTGHCKTPTSASAGRSKTDHLEGNGKGGTYNGDRYKKVRSETASSAGASGAKTSGARRARAKGSRSTKACSALAAGCSVHRNSCARTQARSGHPHPPIAAIAGTPMRGPATARTASA